MFQHKPHLGLNLQNVPFHQASNLMMITSFIILFLPINLIP